MKKLTFEDGIIRCAAYIIGHVVGILVAFAGWIYYGWALSVLWNWFVPIPIGLPPIGVTEAMGIISVVAFLVHRQDLKSTEDAKKVVIGYFLRPVYVLTLGYILHCFTQR